MDTSHADDLDRYPEPAAFPTGRLLAGRICSLDAGYPREVRVGQPVLVGVLAGAALARLVGAGLLALVRPGARRRGAAPRFGSLRKGPEYLVSPLKVRDGGGVLREVELHGYFSRHALERGDLVRLSLRRQADRNLPPRVARLSNLTTGQVLTPRAPTLWSHLGPALLLQAAGGLVVAGLSAWFLTAVLR